MTEDFLSPVTEIYNYIELREELKQSGCFFRSSSDTEVVLEAIAQWGLEKTLGKLVGMFAFALWDGAERKLFLVRDRAGKKPLYYYRKNHYFCFASELNAFKNLAAVQLNIKEASIYQYLTFGYVPSPATIYENVWEIMPGCFAVVCDDLSLVSKSYWSVPSDKFDAISFDDAVRQADELLSEAVKIRLRSDVPVGCFLSGGIDSGLLTALATTHIDHPLKTFTVSLASSGFDEAPHAQLVSNKYQTDHQVIIINPDVRDLLPKVVHAYGQPFADASAIPSYCVAEQASKYVKVVLNGEGGDELFGGYRRHLAVKLFTQCTLLNNKSFRHYFKNVYNLLPPPDKFRSPYAFTHRFARGVASSNHFDRYIMWCVDGFTENEKSELYRDSVSQYQSSIDLLSQALSATDEQSFFDIFMFADFRLNMHDDMLVKMDIATMAHSIEGRNPFLDQRIIEWAFRLPLNVKLKGCSTKPILRELARRYLPDELINAPKRGFEIPLISWIREDLFSMIRDIFFSSNSIILRLFNRNYVDNLLTEKLCIEPSRWSRRVWILFMLAMWEDQICRK